MEKPTQAPGVMLALLAISYGLCHLDRLLMVVMGETIKGEFGLSDKQLSLLTGAAFVLVYGVCGIVFGWACDRRQRNRVLALALALWSLATMVCGFAQSFVQLAIARMGVGAGEGANAPVAFSLISDLYPPAKRSMATAIFMAGGMAGVLAAFVVGSWVGGHWGWRAAFLVAGPPGLILAAFAFFYCRDPEREAAAEAAAPGKGSFGIVMGDPRLLLLLLAQAISSFCSVGMMQWLPMFFIRSHHLALSQIGLLFGPALAGGMGLGMLLGGVVGNRVARRSTAAMIGFCALALAVIAPMYVLLLWVPSMPLALGLTFLTTGISAVYVPISAAAWQTVCNPQARGTAAGISGLMVSITGGAACPFVVGYLSDLWRPALGAESLRYALMASMGFCLVGAGLYALSALGVARADRGRISGPSTRTAP